MGRKNDTEPHCTRRSTRLSLINNSNNKIESKSSIIKSTKKPTDEISQKQDEPKIAKPLVSSKKRQKGAVLKKTKQQIPVDNNNLPEEIDSNIVNDDDEAPESPKPSTSASKKTKKRSKKRGEEDAASPSKISKVDPQFSSGESDWEEVEEPISEEAKPLHITLNKPKSKEEQFLETELRRRINRFRNEVSLNAHKTQLLMYVSHGLLMSNACNDTLLRAIALSQVPSAFICLTQLSLNTKHLTKLLKWFTSAFMYPAKQHTLTSSLSVCDHLAEVIEKKCPQCARDKCATLVTILRAIGFHVRLIMSVHPNPVKQVTKCTKEGAETSKESKTKSVGDIKGAKSRDQPDYWAELYLEDEERWIALDMSLCAIDRPADIEKGCQKPVHYVFAFDNDNGVRDVTGRYSSDFLTPKVRRMRLAGEWLRDLFKAFPGKHRLRNRIEDKQIHDHLLSLPMPTTVSDFKNHPLYVLERDLLKFEAIYPRDLKELGIIRKEKVYAREAVHTLHCKESWIKDARTIKKGEEPYKIVKARPKMGVPKDEQVERPLPLFGFWQTEQYVPEPVVNGKIPRNEYGNVELFKECMLPPGSVHVQVPGLLHVAKSMDIDCAPAMVGWEFHGHRSVPVLDGWIVPKSKSKKLLKEWEKCQVIEAQRREERCSKKALQNWKKFTKGLLLREAVQRNFRIKPGHKERNGAHAEKDETLDGPAEDVAETWPQNKRKFILNNKQ